MPIPTADVATRAIPATHGPMVRTPSTTQARRHRRNTHTTRPLPRTAPRTRRREAPYPRDPSAAERSSVRTMQVSTPRAARVSTDTTRMEQQQRSGKPHVRRASLPSRQYATTTATAGRLTQMHQTGPTTTTDEPSSRGGQRSLLHHTPRNGEGTRRTDVPGKKFPPDTPHECGCPPPSTRCIAEPVYRFPRHGCRLRGTGWSRPQQCQANPSQPCFCSHPVLLIGWPFF